MTLDIDTRYYRPCHNKAVHCLSISKDEGAYICDDCLGNSKAYMPINKIPESKIKRALYGGLCQCSILIEDDDNEQAQTPSTETPNKDNAPD